MIAADLAMKLIFITDVHANLPALRAAVATIGREGYDLLIHGGYAIAIGPCPKECLEVLLALPRIQFIMCNHDRYFFHGLPVPRPHYMSDGEVGEQPTLDPRSARSGTARRRRAMALPDR